jgi:phosphatidylglycerol:prolipoprotein diacylglycerol transferase
MKPVLFSMRIGERVVGVHTYGVLIAIGFAAGIAVAWRQARRQGLDGGRILDLSFWILIAGLLGSRALYVAVNARSFASICLDGTGSGAPRTAAQAVWDCSRALHVWEGGLVFYGGLLAASATVALFARRQGWSFWVVGDVFAPGLALGHAFGRLGCFAAGCCFGKACLTTSTAFCVTFPHDSVAFDELRAVGAVGSDSAATPPLHATQLYEAVGELLIFTLLLLLRRHRDDRAGSPGRPGVVMLTYAALYAVLRFGVELFRGDIERSFVAVFSTPRLAAALALPIAEPILLSSGQLLSLLVLVLSGAGLLLYRRSRAAP